MDTHSTPTRLRSLPRPIAMMDRRLTDRCIAAIIAALIVISLVSIPFGLGIVEISGLAGTVAGLCACVVSLVLAAIGAVSALIAEEGRRDGVVAQPSGWTHSGEPLFGGLDDPHESRSGPSKLEGGYEL